MVAVDEDPLQPERQPEYFGDAEAETNVQDGGYDLARSIVHDSPWNNMKKYKMDCANHSYLLVHTNEDISLYTAIKNSNSNKVYCIVLYCIVFIVQTQSTMRKSVDKPRMLLQVGCRNLLSTGLLYVVSFQQVVTSLKMTSCNKPDFNRLSTT